MKYKNLVKSLLKLVTNKRLSVLTRINSETLKNNRKNDFSVIQQEKISIARKLIFQEFDLIMFDILNFSESQLSATLSLLKSCINSDFVLNAIREYYLFYKFIPQLALQIITSNIRTDQNQLISTFTTPTSERKYILIKDLKTNIVYFKPVVKHDGGFYYTIFDVDGSVIVMSHKSNFKIY